MTKTITIFVSACLGIAIGVVGSHMVVPRHESPYLKHPQRLSDVVAAILVMGTYKFDSMPTDTWQECIGGRPNSAASWADVFTQHPEFFRSTGRDKAGKDKWSLVWRRARPYAWDTETGKAIGQDELKEWAPEDKEKRLSREPLRPEDATKLAEMAVNMQTQEIARREELRWWVPVVVGVICVFIGARIKS